MSLEGGSVFVTGGSRGIGKAIALRFASLGVKRVAIGYLRNDSAAETTAEELRAGGAEPVLVRGNVASERVLEQVAELGPLDALVHNAATGVIRPALETDPRHWEWTLTANARALLDLARVAAPSMPAGSEAGEAQRDRLADAPRASRHEDRGTVEAHEPRGSGRSAGAELGISAQPGLVRGSRGPSSAFEDA